MTSRPQLIKKKKVRSSLAPEGAREKMLAIATGLFAEKGFHAVSVRDISKAAGLNVSLVSYYFGGKEGLYTAILEEHMASVVPRLREIVTRFKAIPLTREAFVSEIRALAQLFVEMRMTNPQISVLIQRERLNGLPFGRRMYEEIVAPAAEEIVSMIAQAQERGLIRKDINPRSYFICFLESIFGFFIFHDCRLKNWKEAHRFPKDKDAFIDFLVRLYTEGVFA